MDGLYFPKTYGSLRFDFSSLNQDEKQTLIEQLKRIGYYANSLESKGDE